MSKRYRSWGEASMDAPIFQMENLPIMLRQYVLRDLEGRLLTLIESLGIGEKREGIVKSYVRRELWDVVHQAGFIIPDAVDIELRDQGMSTAKE